MKERIYFESKVQKIDQEIAKTLQKIGITYPHESLAFFRSIYSELEKPNKNNVILAQSVENDIPQLIGCQVNFSHKRYGFICGQILYAFKNNNNEIEVIFSFHKSVYDKEYQNVLASFAKGELTVSFELLVDKANVEIVDGGYRKLKQVQFDGMGLLLSGETPACSVAIVFEQAKRLISDALHQDNKELVYASIKDISKRWTEIGELLEKSINDKKLEGDKTMNKKARQALLAKFKEEVTKELGEEAVKDWTDEQFEIELKKRVEAEEQTKEEKPDASKNEAEESKEEKSSDEKVDTEKPKEDEKSKETSEDKETEEKDEAKKKADELKAKEEADKLEAEKQAKEAEIQKRKETQNIVYEVTEDSEKGTMEVVETITTQREVDGKVTKDEKVVRTTVYTQATIDAIKAEYDTKITAKDEEIKSLKLQVTAYQEKEKAEKVSVIRAELGDFAKDLSDEQLFDEDKVQIARLEKKISELKTKKDGKVIIAKDETLETGHAKPNEEDDELDIKQARKQYVKSKVK